jgi:hypothetical protein
MIIYRLMRCTMVEAIVAATTLNRVAPVEHQQSRRARLHRSSTMLGHKIAWMLAIDRGVKGVLAHLSAEPPGGLPTRVRRRSVRVALHRLSARKLNELADVTSRSQATPEDDLQDGSARRSNGMYRA